MDILSQLIATIEWQQLSTAPYGLRGHDRALKLADVSASRKAATCRRTPNLEATQPWTKFPQLGIF